MTKYACSGQNQEYKASAFSVLLYPMIFCVYSVGFESFITLEKLKNANKLGTWQKH